ncbi:MAG TPA: hypothetical protein VEO54_16440 [Thermoanaerobaculia bacterium]|nr:hypothetical protein [Thermoanaerobaculia bacterium]
MKIVWHSSIDDIGAAALEPLEGSPVDFSHGLLRAMERSLWGDLAVRYLCVEDERGLCGFVPLYFGTNLGFMALMPKLIRLGYEWVVERFGLAMAYRVAIVGSLISDRGFWPLRPDADAARVLDRMIAAIDAFAREEHAQLVIIKDVHQDFPGIDRFRAAKFMECHSLPTVRVDTTFQSERDYIAGLSANGRSSARRIIKKSEERFTFEFVADYAPLVPEVYPLWRATFLKAEFKLEELPPQFFVECAKSSPPESELLVCRRDGVIVGAYLALYHRGQQLNKRIGIDYRDPDSPLIYNALNMRCLLRAAERGIPLSYLGQTAYTPKLRLGGHLEEQFLFIKPYRFDVGLSLPIQRLATRRFRREIVERETS